jgi:hypothetical protein
MRSPATTLFALALLACAPAFAPAFAGEQPPARVGRVSFISGTLAFYGPGDSDWSAKVNYPVAVGEWFGTDPQSWAEIRIGAETIDVGGDTQFDIADLGDRVLKADVMQGRIEVNLRQFGPDESVEIDIPRGGVWLLQRGIYDIEIGTADQPTRISVFEGSARFVGGGADLTIRAGDAVVLSGTDTIAAAVERATKDDFVKWVPLARLPSRQARCALSRAPGNDRVRGTRRLWRLGHCSGLRGGLVPEIGARQLGSLSRRPLGLGRALGMELGR